ncbi:MAG: hypothetical protein ACRERY_11115 [Pseudomonas sp.]
MSQEIILMLHPTFGVLALLSAVWIFVEVLNVSANNLARIRTAAVLLALLIWLAYLVGGYWYVQYYAVDKAIIKAGPWPFAHSFFMETKEHLFFSLLLIATYVPLVAWGTPLLTNRSARRLLLALAGLAVLLGLAMEGSGAIVGLGVKMGLLGR